MLEELKSRGRSAAQAGHRHDASTLYGKALQVCSDCCSDERAILNANSALVLGKMNQWKESKEAAEQATQNDAKYTKGWWRLGQAQSALHNHDKAVKALQQAKKKGTQQQSCGKRIDQYGRKG